MEHFLSEDCGVLDRSLGTDPPPGTQDDCVLKSAEGLCSLPNEINTVENPARTGRKDKDTWEKQ